MKRSAESPVTERLTLAEARELIAKKLSGGTARSKESRDATEEELRQLFLGTLQLYFPDHPPLTEQLYYAKPRRFRADYAFVEQRLLVEIEGGMGTKEGHGGHFAQMMADLRRSRHASAHGWRVFRISRPCLEKEPEEVMQLLRQSLCEIPPSA